MSVESSGGGPSVAPAAFIDPGSRGGQLRRDAHVDPSATLHEVSLGAFCEIGPRCRVSDCRFGDYTYVGNDSEIIYATIGKFCSIAAMTRINPGNHPLERAALHHFTYRASKYGFGDDEPAFFEWRRSHAVTLGHDVWVGHGAIILPGVQIGTGAVIGAGAVVTHDVDEFAIVIGVPARVLRYRFDSPTRAALLRIAWWNWSAVALRAALDDFRALPIEAFCAKYDPELHPGTLDLGV